MPLLKTKGILASDLPNCEGWANDDRASFDFPNDRSSGCRTSGEYSVAQAFLPVLVLARFFHGF